MAAAAQSSHATELEQSYRAVGDRTWTTQDFLETNLAVSRALFEPPSLAARRPQPKQLEVFALLGGLPFQQAFVDRLVEAQRQISAVLGERLHYWVAPENLGVEYCVFKWPTDAWQEEWLTTIRSVLLTLRPRSYRFTIGGVQINPDGCVVAKGFDEDAALVRARAQIKSQLPFLPAKQSGWAHVPLGRILEPLGSDRFAQLQRLIDTLSRQTLATTQIHCMRLVHETRWYMEEREVLAEYALADAGPGIAA